MYPAFDPIAWVIVVGLVIACWPLSQRLRHEKLRPVAAFLLLVSLGGLVAGGVFRGLTGLFGGAGPDQTLGAGAVVAITLVALAAGGLAGWWVLRFPQWRRRPR